MAKKQTKKQQTFAYDEFFAQLGLENLPAADKKKLAEQMQENIENKITLRVMEMLSEEDKKLFDACKTDVDIEEFFKAKKINPGAIAVEEALTFREELLQDASYIEGRLSTLTTEGPAK